MVRQYMDICDTFSCKAKVYPKMSACMKKIGSPDLLILFTGTVSHKMIKCALNDIKGKKTTVARSHSSSAAALKNAASRAHLKNKVKARPARAG